MAERHFHVFFYRSFKIKLLSECVGHILFHRNFRKMGCRHVRDMWSIFRNFKKKSECRISRTLVLFTKASQKSGVSTSRTRVIFTEVSKGIGSWECHGLLLYSQKLFTNRWLNVTDRCYLSRSFKMKLLSEFVGHFFVKTSESMGWLHVMNMCSVLRNLKRNRSSECHGPLLCPQKLHKESVVWKSRPCGVFLESAKTKLWKNSKHFFWPRLRVGFVLGSWY